MDMYSVIVMHQINATAYDGLQKSHLQHTPYSDKCTSIQSISSTDLPFRTSEGNSSSSKIYGLKLQDVCCKVSIVAACDSWSRALKRMCSSFLDLQAASLLCMVIPSTLIHVQQYEIVIVI